MAVNRTAFICTGTLLSLLIPSCTSLERNLPTNLDSGDEMTLVASIGQTKTTNDHLETDWTEGDRINLLYCSSGGSDFTSVPFTNVGGDKFNGTFSQTGGTYDFYTVYPYSVDNTSAKSVSVTVAASQQQEGYDSMAHTAGTGYPLFGIRRGTASSSSMDIPMSNALALAKVVVTNALEVPITVSGIDLTSSEKISGDFTVNLTSGRPVWSTGSSTSNSVILSVGNGSAIPSGQSAAFYVGFAPHTASSLQLGVTASRGGAPAIRISKTSASEASFPEGVIKTLNIRYDDSRMTAATFNLENASVAAYLDDAESTYTDDNSKSVVSSYCSNSESNRKDIPSPVTLSWTSDISGTRTVYVYDDPSCSHLEMSTTTSSDKVDIYNLIPGRQYWYSVRSAGGSILSSGMFTTTGRVRMMKVSDTYSRSNGNNCRDIGGLETTDGKIVRYNLIFRGTAIDDITDSEKDYMTGYMNIGADIDLRKKSKNQDVFDSSVTYSNAGYSTFDDLTNKSKTKTTFTDIFDTVSKGKACYIHCICGADRTGYICLLIEALLGVSPKDCSIEYELTSFSVAGKRSRTGGSDAQGYFSDGLDYINDYTGSSFKEKAENILLDAGLTEHQIASFRKVMLE